MNTRAKIIVAAAALAAAAGVNAQSSSVDRSFTASGDNCTQITWSAEMLAKHPKIASACQEILHRDGKTFVKFEGTVKKVAKGGTEVVMAMKGADDLTLSPKPGRTVMVNGNKVPVKNLRPGDTLTFYVPEDRVVAAEIPPEPAAPVEYIPIAEPAPVEQVAQTETPMPKTASEWPLVALLGALAIGFAGVMRTRRAFGGR